MPKPNYQFEKRQREQQKKLKKEEKAQRKAQPVSAEQPTHESESEPPQQVDPVSSESASE